MTAAPPSHPLTLSPVSLMRSPVRALRMFLHEQLHWMEGPGTEAAAAEFSRRWPDPPPPAGAADPRSTWIHLSVCTLEYLSLAEILGPAAAAASGSIRATRGSTIISSPALTGSPPSCAAMASRCPGSLRFPAATSANSDGQSRPARDPASANLRRNENKPARSSLAWWHRSWPSGVNAPRPLLRRLPAYAKEAFRQKLSAACSAHAGLGQASLVLFDVSTLYFGP